MEKMNDCNSSAEETREIQEHILKEMHKRNELLASDKKVTEKYECLVGDIKKRADYCLEQAYVKLEEFNEVGALVHLSVSAELLKLIT
ncbi:MAG: hypothetical protein GY861_22470 [bacterium]|nr:hypothetical protein [bacterium]